MIACSSDSAKRLAAIRPFVTFVGMFRLLLQGFVFSQLFVLPGLALTLSEAVERAVAENRNLAVLRQQLHETTARREQAQSAYLPQFDLNGAYTYVSRLPELSLGEILPVEIPEIEFSTHNLVDLNLTGGYLLLDFGKRRMRSTQAELGHILQLLKLKVATHEVALQTVSAYSVAALATERVELLRNYVENADSHLADARNKFDNGLVSEFDLLKSELQVKVFSEELVVAKAELLQSLLRLSEVVGADSGSVIVVDQPLSALNLIVPTDQQLNELLDRKPEVELTHKQAELSELQENIEKLRPKVTLFSSAGWRNNYLPDPGELLFNFTGGAKISYRFFDGGLAHYKQVEEQAKQVRFQLESDRIVSEAARLVAITRQELVKIGAKRAATAEKLTVARKALEIAAVSYGVGLITNTEYLDTELEIQNIEMEALNDRFGLLQAQLELKNAVGFWPEVE